MSDETYVTAEAHDEGVVLSFEETLYPRDAIFGAAYTLLDRCFVHLDREGTRLLVRLRAKPGVKLVADALAGEFQNEALSQSWRRDIVSDNRALIESMTSRVLTGAAGPAGLDDLLGGDLGDLGDAFDDPLGIAVSWEEKYGKQDAAPEPPVEAQAKPTDDSGEQRS